MTFSPTELTLLASNPRASLSSWCRYAHFVRAAIRCSPHPYVFTPTSFSPATVISQIRDAIRGCIAFGYEPDVDAISSWWSKTVARKDGDKVVLGPQVKQDRKAEARDESLDGMTFTELTLEEVHAFMLLISHGRLSGPVLVLHPRLIPESIPNCEVIVEKDGRMILL